MYEACCGRFISGAAKPETAEELMRSRYSAYARRDVEYILATCLKDEDHDIDEEATRKWAENATWLGLHIIKTDKGGPSDDEGMVEFRAVYSMDGLREEHHEKARFEKRDGSWIYVEGEVIPETIVRDSPKVGRNDPCPCGSGKKYKKCCGRGS
jgi:SEC-C motif-containing protein